MADAGAIAAWTWDPWTLLALASAAFLYGRGFRRLSAERPEHFPRGRAVAFFLGLAVVFVAVASPLDPLADWLLQAHMVQHWLLMMVAPPLVWWGAPAVPLLRGLPAGWLRDGVGPVLSRPAVRRALRFLVRPPVATAVLVAVVIAWHLPRAYELALRSPFWHDVEHACFFWAALLFWHPVMAPWPSRRRASPIAPVLQVGGFMLFNGLFSAIFAFSGEVFYPSYAAAPRLAGLSAIADQNAAGAFMWVAGSLPMAAAAAGLMVSWLGTPSDARRPGAPAPVGGGAAPGRSAPRQRPRWLAVTRFQRLVRGGLFALAALVVLDGWLGPQRPSALNLAGVLPWTWWRPLVVVGLLLAGNLFCGVCPIVASRGVAGRWLGRPFRWPRALRGRWPAAALFVAYLLAYEVFALWDGPAATAWLIAGYFGGAFVVEGLFPRGSFCRHVCPIGQFQFVGSLVSPRSVQAADAEVCARCTTHDCLRGRDDRPGCPTGLFLPTKAGGLDCTLCLDCARACPHDNVAWLAVPRTAALGLGRARPAAGAPASARPPAADATAMVGLFVFGAFVNAAAMVAPAEAARAGLASALGRGPGELAFAGLLALALVGAPLAIVRACAAPGARSGGVGSEGGWARAARFLPALVPIGLAMWTAHFVLHLLMAPDSLGPPLERLLHGDASIAVARTPDGLAAGLAALDPALWILGVGLVASLVALARLVGRVAATPAEARALAWPWALLAVLLHGAGVWILRQPMAMRGMLM